jgi:hypothetical protein
MSSAASLAVGVRPREGFEPAAFLVGFGDPLADGGGGFGFGADDGAVAVELLVELADPVPDLPFLCLLVGVGLGGPGELGAGVVEVLVGEQLGHPVVEAGHDAVLPDVDGRRVVTVVGGVVAGDLAADRTAPSCPGSDALGCSLPAARWRSARRAAASGGSRTGSGGATSLKSAPLRSPCSRGRGGLPIPASSDATLSTESRIRCQPPCHTDRVRTSTPGRPESRGPRSWHRNDRGMTGSWALGGQGHLLDAGHMRRAAAFKPVAESVSRHVGGQNRPTGSSAWKTAGTGTPGTDLELRRGTSTAVVGWA